MKISQTQYLLFGSLHPLYCHILILTRKGHRELKTFREIFVNNMEQYHCNHKISH